MSQIALGKFQQLSNKSAEKFVPNAGQISSTDSDKRWFETNEGAVPFACSQWFSRSTFSRFACRVALFLKQLFGGGQALS